MAYGRIPQQPAPWFPSEDTAPNKEVGQVSPGIGADAAGLATCPECGHQFTTAQMDNPEGAYKQHPLADPKFQQILRQTTIHDLLEEMRRRQPAPPSNLTLPR